jgi:pimeloyl-ACP methyl ester carboxylesterase
MMAHARRAAPIRDDGGGRERAMTTYVLVHGAWGGAHGFRHVRRLLHAAGHEVFTPSLTGVGERAHLTGPQVGLATHVLDVVNTVLYEDLDEIALVGYSYGGFVVTGTIDHIGERVAHLVFVDAFVPHDGDTLIGLAGRPPPGRITLREEWLVPAPPRDYDDPDEAAFADARRTPQPLRCFTEPVHLSRPLEEFPFTRTFVKATADLPNAPGAVAFWAAADRARQSPAWRYREIATNHMIPSNRPDELVEVLLEVAADVTT